MPRTLIKRKKRMGQGKKRVPAKRKQKPNWTVEDLSTDSNAEDEDEDADLSTPLHLLVPSNYPKRTGEKDRNLGIAGEENLRPGNLENAEFNESTQVRDTSNLTIRKREENLRPGNLENIEFNESTSSQETDLESINEWSRGVKINNCSSPKPVDEIHVAEIINQENPFWKIVLTQYKKVGKINNQHRKFIVDAIIQNAREKGISISRSMSKIADQICAIFPTETQSTYFLQIGKKKSGILYNRYNYCRRKEKRLLKNEENCEEISEVVSLEVADAIAILKNSERTDQCYIDSWRSTFEYRRKQILQYETFDELLNEWPIIAKPIGPFLIELDFEKIYGDKSIQPRNWNLFFSKNWKCIKTKIKRKKSLSLCQKVVQLEESKSKDAALSFLLHILLPPAFKKKGFKPSVVDSTNTFLRFVKDENMDAVIQNRIKACWLKGIKIHPYIIGLGQSPLQMEHFYVVIHNIKFRSDSFLSALNLCSKMFILLNIPYPPECKAVWILLNKIFFNINIDTAMTARIYELVNDLNLNFT